MYKRGILDIGSELWEQLRNPKDFQLRILKISRVTEWAFTIIWGTWRTRKGCLLRANGTLFINNRMQTESKTLLLSCYDFYQGEWFFIWKGRKYIFELIILKNKKTWIDNNK